MVEATTFGHQSASIRSRPALWPSLQPGSTQHSCHAFTAFVGLFRNGVLQNRRIKHIYEQTKQKYCLKTHGMNFKTIILFFVHNVWPYKAYSSPKHLRQLCYPQVYATWPESLGDFGFVQPIDLDALWSKTLSLNMNRSDPHVSTRVKLFIHNIYNICITWWIKFCCWLLIVAIVIWGCFNTIYFPTLLQDRPTFSTQGPRSNQKNLKKHKESLLRSRSSWELQPCNGCCYDDECPAVQAPTTWEDHGQFPGCERGAEEPYHIWSWLPQHHPFPSVVEFRRASQGSGIVHYECSPERLGDSVLVRFELRENHYSCDECWLQPRSILQDQKGAGTKYPSQTRCILWSFVRSLVPAHVLLTQLHRVLISLQHH